MKFTHILTLGACVALLSACAVTSTDKGTKAAEAKGGILGLSRVDDITIDNTKALAGQNQVVIGSFKVAFLEEKRGSAKAGGGFGGKSSAKMTLTGVSPQVMQAVTDRAYADFVAQLQAKGYTVVDRAALLANADFAKADSKPSPLTEEASFFGASTDTTFMTPTGFGPLHFFMGEYGRMGGFGFSNPAMAATKYVQEAGIPVISVAYTVDFANSEGSGGRFSMSSSLEVGQGISVAPGGGVTFIGGTKGGTFSANPNANIKLGQPVSSDAPFGTVTNTSSDVGIAAETALNAVSALMGAGTNQSRSFSIDADPAKYQDVATLVLAQANAALVGKMAASR